MPVKIFFSYAHEDEDLLKELKIHLEIFRRQGLIEMWYDRNISAGSEWAYEIDTHLNRADIILLLVSQYFLASDYCYGTEMMQAIKRHERREAIVIPIILRPVHFQIAPFGKLRPLPTDAKPVTSKSWANQDEAFFDVAEGVRKIIVETMSKASSPLLTRPPSPTSFREERNAQDNLLIQSAYMPQQQSMLSVPMVSAYESVHVEGLFNEAVIAQSNGNLEKALELYQQVRKLDPNFKKGQLTSQLKRLLQQLESEARGRTDQGSQMKYLNELLKLEPNDTSVQKRLEKLSLPYIARLRQQALSARQSSKWEIEYKSWKEILKWRPQHVEALRYIKPAQIKYLQQQAKKARKAASWDDEARIWNELLGLLQANTAAKAQAKRRLTIATKNQDHIWMYEDALHLESEDRLDEARKTLEELWHYSPYYGDPKRLARKVGIFIPLPLEKWRKAIWLTLFASSLVLLMIAIILSALKIDSSVAWVGLIVDLVVLYSLSKYWLLIDW